MPNHTTAPGRARRTTVALAALAITAAGLGATTAGAAGPVGGAPHAERVVAERAHGEAAIQALGSRLPEVAAAHGTTADELRRRLRSDRELWVDTTGALLYIDESLAHADDEDAHHEHADQPAETSDPVLGDHATSEAFQLHSRPGAARVIHLDFDGHTSPGGGWSGTAGTPYDLDGQPSTFSETERRAIIDVWRHVAEDFAPFAIDVTTQDPGIDAIRRTGSTDLHFGTRVVVTPTKTDCGSCGGIAYVGTYDIHGGSSSTGWTHDHYQPAWVYVAGSNAKNIAEAASHEAGHNLGLSHDGVSGGTSYYAGHGDWAPIMGVGYYEPITQWSKGEYAGASNTEDDLSVIAANGGTVAGDDHGGTTSTATPLAAGTVDVSGVLGARGDHDAFTFTTDGGTLSLQVTPAAVGADADLSLRLLDSTATTLQLLDPAGLSASIERLVAAGTYTVVIDGVGAGDPLSTGYTDYASLGRYRLTGTIPADDGSSTTENRAPVAAVTATPTSGTAPLAVSFDGTGSSDADGDALSYTWDFGDGTTGTGATTSHTYAAGTHTATLTVSDGSLSSTASVTISASTAVSKPAAPTLSGSASGSTVTLAWGDVSGETAYDVYREYRHRNGSFRGRKLIKTLGSDVITTTDAPGSGTFRYQVVARNSAGSSGSNLQTVTVGGTSKTKGAKASVR